MFCTALQVFEFLRSDFSNRKREHCVRIDLHTRKGSGMGVSPGVVGNGLDEFDMHLRDAVASTFEAREKEYEDEVRGSVSVKPLLSTRTSVNPSVKP